MEKTIKVDYKNKIMIKFQLSFSSGITCLWEEMQKRFGRFKIFEEMNHNTFQIRYVEDGTGKYLQIASDEDLSACMAKSNSNTIYMTIDKVEIKN